MTVDWLRTRPAATFAALLTMLVAFVGLAAPALAADNGPVPYPAASDRASGSAGKAALLTSWPEAGASLWVPPRQGRLVFTGPVSATTSDLRLTGVDGTADPVDDLTRVTKGDSVTEIVFKFPAVDPGTYRLSWTVESAAGKTLTGMATFTLEKRFTAPGGGNHRHEGHLYLDSAVDVAVRAVLVLACGLLLLAVWRTDRGVRSVLEPVLPRVSGALFVVSGLASATQAVLHAVEEYPSDPVPGVLGEPGLWFALLVVVAGLVQVLVGYRQRPALLLAVAAVLFAGAAVDHGTDLWALTTSVVFTLMLAAAAALTAVALQMAVYLVHRAPRPARGLGWPLLAAAMLVSVLSLTLVVLHAHGLVIEGDFAQDLRSRSTAAVVLSSAAVALAGVAWLQGRWPARIAGPVLSLLVLASTVPLLWVPPPTAGL